MIRTVVRVGQLKTCAWVAGAVTMSFWRQRHRALVATIIPLRPENETV